MGYDGYVRVSRVAGREGDSFQSPDQQRETIQGWAQSRGVQIDQWHQDMDISGGTLQRPGLDAVVERIKAGKTEGVVVAKLSRFSRAGVASALGLFEEIYAAGGEVVAVDVGIDPTTPVGKFARTIMLALNEMELERIKEGWSSVKARAVERGVFLGPTPLGFDKGDAGLVPNDDAPLVVRAFDISANDGLHAALVFCEATWPSRKWTATTARRLFANRVYKGEIVSGEFVGKMEPLVDEYVWSFAQHPATERRKAKDAYPLSGIAACAACGKTLVGHTTGKPGKEQRAYRCTTKGCPLHVKADPLEQFVLDAVKDSPHRARTGDEIFQSAKAVIAAQVELERHMDDIEASAANRQLWQKGLKTREAALVAAQRASDEAAKSDSATGPFASVASLVVKRSREPLEDRVALTLA